MYRKILVGYDDTDQAKDALALGKQLADATGADLVAAGVFPFDPIWGGYDPHFHDADVEYARKIEAAAKSVGAEAEATPSSSPARGLHELAEEIGADLILVGSARHGRVGQTPRGRPRSRPASWLAGAQSASRLAATATTRAIGIASIAVGFDGSEESGLALIAATQLASTMNTEELENSLPWLSRRPSRWGRVGTSAATSSPRRSRTTRCATGSRRHVRPSPTTSRRKPWLRVHRRSRRRARGRHSGAGDAAGRRLHAATGRSGECCSGSVYDAARAPCTPPCR